ncbi:hydroxyacylglutathione hydrolase [Pelagibacteraceae bacterium]|jgi:hydroxyacylglutathione hydrolase|nr:hydroxyacylglutathione hydrolase [Pelagibacteraceae bacterium]MDB9742990.1 hydroxyacylglutathione hydrolase [Pelagibacteraceae bacterium]MDC0339500.1 hydroxyacylglutathione hydrolase [Pelagibacteraceae bacterium]MDC0366132.1 hydroxyacylglutathione hydrolase [Pelagibacteraceae bacterium]MDC3233373.1 hydroxyacylglutathione hydrolase [Pelagibacteraceae bacterium]|tara:strand:+ start:1050 stop:1799 length:750 start_codon:yes stop_codon:yes gene_type:complete
MNIEIISCLDDNYSYLIHEEKTNTVAIIDPSEFDPCDELIKKKYKKLDYILNTHHHYDHVGGNKMLKTKYNSTVLGFDGDKDRIPCIDKFLKDNQNFKIGNLNILVIFIPGHTKGHIAFYLEKEKIVFTGDTLFSLGCGKIFEGTYKQMFNSLNKLKNLPAATKVYSGHEYTKKNLDFCLTYDPNNEFLKKKAEWINSNNITMPSSIGEELKTNIFLRCEEQSIKDALNLKNSSDQEIFVKLRDLKDNF